MSNFRMLTTKNTLNSAFLMPTLTGGELTKSGVKPPVITPKKKFHDTTKKSAKSVLFFLPKNSQFSGSKKRH